MNSIFDWELLKLPRWTPLSRFGVRAERLMGEFFAMNEWMYLMANSGFGGTEDDPGVAAVLWARSRSAAFQVFDQNRLADGLDDIPVVHSPPVQVLGFEPLTYGAALAFEKRGGGQPLLTAGYRFSDGAFVTSQLMGATREYVFSSLNPEEHEDPIAIIFNLPEVG